MSIHPTAVIEKSVELSSDVIIGPFVVLSGEVKVASGVVVNAHAVIEGRTTIGRNTKIGTASVIGSPPQDLKYSGEKTQVIIGENCTIREFVTINRGTADGLMKTEIGNDTFIMSYAHVAHDCIIGNEVILANCVTLAGHITIEDKVIIGGITGIHQFVRIGEMAIVGGLTRLNKDAVPFCKVAGSPPKVYGLNTVGLKRRNYSEKDRQQLKRIYKIIFRSGLNTSQALKKIERDSQFDSPLIKHLVEFIKNSSRGICKR